jgi:hypothetical protein
MNSTLSETTVAAGTMAPVVDDGSSTDDVVRLVVVVMAPFVIIPLGIIIARFFIRQWRRYKYTRDVVFVGCCCCCCTIADRYSIAALLCVCRRQKASLDVGASLPHHRTPWRDSFNLWFSTSKLGTHACLHNRVVIFCFC